MNDLLSRVPPEAKPGYVLVFDGQAGDWRWAPLPLAAEQGDLKQSVADFLRGGLRSLQSPPNDGAPPHWHEGYLEGSKRLARDLCRHLDIAWDDKANEPTKGA